MKVIIISVGDELIMGQGVDTNSAWLSAELVGIGLDVREHVTAGDDVEILAEHLQRAAKLAQVVLVTGGLGPTEDDLTRHALVGALGSELVLHESSLAHIADLFERRGMEMPERNRIQAMIPAGCQVIENPLGTAPGIIATLAAAALFLLPGVPVEMKAMFAQTVKPQLTEMNRGASDAGAIISRSLGVTGLSESKLAELLGDMMARGQNPLVNSTVSQGVIQVRINARAADEAAARGLIEPVEKDLRRRLGNKVFGMDGQSLSGAVGQILIEQAVTLAVAESCTGGLLAKTLTDNPGSSQYFCCGWVTYSNEAKTTQLQVAAECIERHGAVSEEVAREMAAQARRLGQSDYALAITGIAGPTGAAPEKPVGLVYIALADHQGGHIERHVFTGDRDMVRTRSVNTALDMLRYRLL